MENEALLPAIRSQAGRPVLSKTVFVQGTQCPKLLWYRFNRADEIPNPDERQQQIFKEANEVGLLARRLYPNGTTVPAPGDGVGDSVERTASVLPERRPVFEASFQDGRCYARVDILVPLDADGWEIVEVKSSTKVKEEHYWDVTFQAHVLRCSGLNVKKCSVLHLNPDYVRNGELDVEGLFLKEDVTEQVMNLLPAVEHEVPLMLALEQQEATPEVKIGAHCDKPNACPLQDKCWSYLPAQNVTELTYGKEKKWQLLDQGILLLKDIPGGFKLTKNQQVQKAAAVSGKPHVRKADIWNFLNTLKHPRCYFDFETYATAVPMFNNLRPWQAVPFQFSIHIVDAPSATPRHLVFLAEGKDDPRPKFLNQLKSAVEGSGSLIAYHSSFEKSIMEKCAEAYPAHSDWIKEAVSRIVDLEVPFREFAYYNPAQTGRSTLKLVMPAITGRGYDELAINKGDTASQQFLRITFEEVPDDERRRVRQALLDYCGRDTEGMVWIVEALEVTAGDLLKVLGLPRN